jgi:hypothetical protein
MERASDLLEARLSDLLETNVHPNVSPSRHRDATVTRRALTRPVPRTALFHSRLVDGGVHHNNPSCRAGAKVGLADRVAGPGSLPLCRECSRLKPPDAGWQLAVLQEQSPIVGILRLAGATGPPRRESP